MSDWLTPEEVAEYTGRSRWKAQARALSLAKVPFDLNLVGRPLVPRSAVPSLSARPAPRQRAPRRGPNWGATRGARAQAR